MLSLMLFPTPPLNTQKSKTQTALGPTKRARISIRNEFWWFDDPYRNRSICLDPLFNGCAWNLGRLAKHLGVGDRTLARIIEESIGINGKTWLRNVRIVRASHLLRESPKIEALARTLGFSQHSDLTREFKKLVGVLPSEFQKQERKRAFLPE